MQNALIEHNYELGKYGFCSYFVHIRFEYISLLSLDFSLIS